MSITGLTKISPERRSRRKCPDGTLTVMGVGPVNTELKRRAVIIISSQTGKRGCDPADCNRYEKGERLGEK